MLQTIFDLLIRNWKTTASGITTILIWCTGYFGIELSLEQKTTLSAIVLSIGQLFSKDGNKL